ncbi:dihydrolipoyl dehydrogenase family protein [Pseudooceanicola sp. C21-150M6]|uniref:dihydrolipoyl dehydrogenase family protein n=1 Tax=Pseudooceanicola sp. C21-150M6 TaxID=3434355 RepID=UPI003D7F1AFF
MSQADLIVIGAGAAGLSVAAGAAQMGARVVLVEAGEMGGDCLNHGCIPSKSLIAAAARVQMARDGFPGMVAAEPEVDFAAVMDHVRTVIAGIAPHDGQARFERLGVRVIRGWARFVGPDSVAVGDEVLRARRIVIATGSRPAVPVVPGLDRVAYLTNETVFALTALPAHLAVMGAGPVGVELAQAFRRLGAKVTLIDRGAMLKREDPQAVAVVRAALLRDGVAVLEECALSSVAADGAAIRLETAMGPVVATHLLVATGREASVAGLELGAAGIAGDARGIPVDRRLRTVNRRVFAVGDVAAGQPRFTHVAGFHAGVVVRQAMLGLPARADRAIVPRATYSAPELAQVGLTETEARARHGDIAVITKPFDENDRARTDLGTGGWIKLVIRRGQVIGVTLVAPAASELIAPWAVSLSQGLALRRIAGTILPYPTRSELGKAAAGAYFSAKLFGNPLIERVVRLIQRMIP